MKKTGFQEEIFQSHIETEKLSGVRTLSVLASILYLMFIVADVYSLSTSLMEAILVRGTVVVILLFGLAYSYHHSFLKHYELTLSMMYLVSAGGIEIMILFAQPDEHAFNVYFVGLLLVIMTLFAWSYFKFRTSFIVTSLIIGSYSYIEIARNLSWSALFVNILFLVSATTIGVTFQLIRDRYIRENFLLQHSLKEQVLEKTKEAETHEHLANHDQLTGLPNSRYAKDRLEKNLKRAKELDMSLVIMYLDLNGFKQVNDIYGHKAGDEVLRIVGKRLKSCVRNGDCAARLGGDEFAVGLMVEKNELGIAQDIREKIIQSIRQPIGFEGNVLQIGTSVGMASYPSSGDKVSVLIEIADKRMYDAKQRMKKKLQEESEITSEEDEEFTSAQTREPVVIFPGT